MSWSEYQEGMDEDREILDLADMDQARAEARQAVEDEWLHGTEFDR